MFVFHFAYDLSHFGLIETEIPRPGEIKATISDVFPATQASVGADAWRK